jgi:rod shape determining protein RodA
MFVIAQISPVRWSRWSPWGYAAGVLLLIAVASPVSEPRAPSAGWISAVSAFQPSEIMKLAMPMTVAWYLGSASCRRGRSTSPPAC